MSKKRKRYYVVWCGHNPGVYDEWADAQEQIHGFRGAKYKSFSTPEEAAEAYRNGYDDSSAKELGQFVSGLRHKRAEKMEVPDWRQFPDVDKSAWAVDASCMGNPGRMEYQGVDLATGKVIFRVGPFDDATNNIGEFLAIIHALALMDKTGQKHTLYSDSKTAISWVHNERVRTTLQHTPRNGKVFELLTRGLTWLQTHSFRTRIIKWDTDNWGEIPADFGRK